MDELMDGWMDGAHHIADLSDCHRPLVVLGAASFHALQPVNKVHPAYLRVGCFFAGFGFHLSFWSPEGTG